MNLRRAATLGLTLGCGAASAPPAAQHVTLISTAPSASASITTPRPGEDDDDLVAVGSDESDPSLVAEPKCVELPSIRARVRPPDPLGVLEVADVRLRSGCVWKSALEELIENKSAAVLGCFDKALAGKRAVATRHVRLTWTVDMGDAQLGSLEVLHFPGRHEMFREAHHVPFDDVTFKGCLSAVLGAGRPELGSSRAMSDATPVTLPAVVDITLQRRLHREEFERAR